jgi:MFS family permease
MLYRSTDRLSRRGAPVKNLSHNASFESFDKDAPSKPGTKHLMISVTYALSGVLLIAVGAAFERDLLSAAAQTVGWTIVFFVASPADSAAYLTVSETFPLEIRSLTIAIFYAIGTGLGGVAAPLVFGKLIESGSRQSIFGGYVFAAVLMFAAAFVAARYAVAAERKPLEQVATPSRQ